MSRPAEFQALSAAGRTTFSAGMPGGRQVTFAERGPAELYAHDKGVQLFEWAGRTGYELAIDHEEMDEKVMDTWTKDAEGERELVPDADREVDFEAE